MFIIHFQEKIRKFKKCFRETIFLWDFHVKTLKMIWNVQKSVWKIRMSEISQKFGMEVKFLSQLISGLWFYERFEFFEVSVKTTAVANVKKSS